MHKGWLRSGIIILFLGVIFFYRLPAVASTSTCPEGSKCIFNDTGPLLIQSQSGNIDLRATSSNKYIYLNYINTGQYGLRVSADGSLSHNGSPIVVADENFYSINIHGLSMGLKGYFGEWFPDIILQAPDQQLFLYSLNPRYWGVDNSEDSVTGVSSIYSLSKTKLPLVSQLALVRDVPREGPPRQYLQYRFNNIDRPDDWGEWIEVCDSSNNCHNFLNLLDDRSNNSLLLYQDPDMLVDSNLKVNDPNSLANCSSLYTSGGVISCGSGGGGGGISGSGTTNYLPFWYDASTLADSILYQDSTNLGLGTASPFTNFHIYDASSGPIITLSGLDSHYRGLTIKNTSSAEQWFVGSNDNNNFVIRQGGSTNLLTASSSGNVGIGTTTPGAKLDVNGSLAVRGAVSFTDATLYAGSGSRLLMVDPEGNVSATSTLAGGSMPGGNTGQILRYGTSGWEATSTIYIKDDGNVGIGTTSPASKLHIITGDAGGLANYVTIQSNGVTAYRGGILLNNTVNFNAYSFKMSASYSGGDNASAQFGYVANNATETFLNNGPSLEIKKNGYIILASGGGRVGIGTITPATKLHIYDASSGPIITLSGLDSNYRGLTIKNTSSAEQWFVGSNDNNNFVIRQGGSTNLLTASSSGNVGIGTTTPGAKLDVNGSLAVRGAVSFTDATLYAGSGSRLLMVDPEGNVSATSTLAGGSMPGGNTGQILRYGTSDWEATSTIYIKDDGNVGIGTTSPGYKLSVAGGGSFDSPVVVGTPNDGSEAVNVDYLNSAISGLGGDNTVTFAGVSVSTFTGNQGGYDSVNNICAGVDLDSHICTTEDILTIINNGNISTIPTTTEGYWISNGPPGYTANANDCAGFTTSSASFLGAVWYKYNTYPSGVGALTKCNSTKNFACCK